MLFLFHSLCSVRYVPQQQWPTGSLSFSQMGDEYIRSTWKLLTEKEIPNYFVKKGCSSAATAINRTWTVLGANHGLFCENLANSCHSFGTADRGDWKSVSLLVGEVPGSSCRADKMRGAFRTFHPSLSGHMDWQRYTWGRNWWLTQFYNLLHLTLHEACK